MLRTTVAAFAAGVGGADTIEVRGFDDAIPGGYPGIRSGFSRRIARNTQLLLLEESTSVVSSTRPAAPGMSRTSPKSWPGKRGRISSRSRQRAASGRPSATSPSRSTGWPRDAPMTSRTGEPRSPGSASSRTSPNNPCPRRFHPERCGTQRPSRICETAPMRTCAAPGPGREVLRCHWGHSPSTTSGPPSPRICSPPAELGRQSGDGRGPPRSQPPSSRRDDRRRVRCRRPLPHRDERRPRRRPRRRVRGGDLQRARPVRWTTCRPINDRMVSWPRTSMRFRSFRSCSPDWGHDGHDAVRT